MLPAESSWDYAGLFALERDRLNELLGSRQAADWQRPSPCPGWSVLGLCCHPLRLDGSSVTSPARALWPA